MSRLQMRTWAEISLDNIAHNYNAIKARLGDGTRFLGVVKADAYGHGAVRVSALLEELGCDYLAVACIDEALALRQAGITLPILVLGHTPPEYVPELIENRLTQTVYSLETAQAYSRAASGSGQSLTVHLKVDTGMSRLGFSCRSAEGDMLSLLKLPHLHAEGIFTHFAVSEARGDTFTAAQTDAFKALVRRLEDKGSFQFEIKHCANSGAMINYDWSRFDMVRTGLALYGLYPGPDTGGLGLRPAMALKTRIVQLRDCAPGDTVSYGRTYTASSPRRIAVIPIGYGDGLHRVLSGKIDVLLRGRRVRQAGAICMDMSMIDVTQLPEARPGDVVTVFGSDGGACIPVEELARLAGTISYELVCAVSARIPRVYTGRFSG